MDRFDVIISVGRREPGARYAKIPRDLEGSVAALSDPKTFAERVARVHADGIDQYGSAPLEDIWGEVDVRASNRGRLKLASLAWTLSALLGEPRSAKHVRLARLIRQDMEAVFRPDLREISLQNKELAISDQTNQL